MVINLISLALILAIYLISLDIPLTIVGSFAVVLILRSLTPIFALLSAKYFPKPEIDLIREQNMMEQPGRGVRILVVTQFNVFKPEDEAGMALYDKIFMDAVEALKQSKPLFALRYQTVLEKKLPLRFFSSICGEKDSGMRKCYSTWLKTIDAKDFGVWKENSEMFLHDGVFNDPVTGEARSSIVIFLFDSRLPKTIVPKADENTETPQEKEKSE
jgi:hypothetical protein